MSASPRKEPPTIENKKARRNYEISETLEAGIILTGSEVKSLRLGGGDIADAHLVVKEGQAFLLNSRIEPYKSGGYSNHEENRSRKLLLHKLEIDRLFSKIREKRVSVIALKIYFNPKGKVKVLLGVGIGKKMADRREDEKKAQDKREMERALRERNKS